MRVRSLQEFRRGLDACVLSGKITAQHASDQLRKRKERNERVASCGAAGAGTELKGLLSQMGFFAAANCRCEQHARAMDAMGPDWCEENISQIVGWLKEEHAKRQSIIPFIPLAAEQLVRLAIRRARKKGNGK